MSNNSTNNSEYISIIDVKDIFIAKLNSCNIIEVNFYDKNIEVQKEHLVLLKKAIFELGKGKKMAVCINSTDFLGISSEARAYAASDDSNEFTLANAVLVKSLANKLLFNFFLNINKPVVATRGFNDKEAAFEWLTNLIKLSNSYQ